MIIVESLLSDSLQFDVQISFIKLLCIDYQSSYLFILFYVNKYKHIISCSLLLFSLQQQIQALIIIVNTYQSKSSKISKTEMLEEVQNSNFSQPHTKYIHEKVSQLRQKFFQGHEKSRVKHKAGIVFIGNSRGGKSTLSAFLGGIKMRLTVQKGECVIEPLQQKHRDEKNLIQHSFSSVTSYPNIHQLQIDGNYYTLVDLPGFKDTSYQKELCNQSYIKGLLEQLDRVLFVMVVKVHSESLTLDKNELEMMKRFMTAFPTVGFNQPKENLCIIINFVEKIETQQKQDAMKAKIIKQIQKQFDKMSEQDKNLEKDKMVKENQMKIFYSKSIESNRMFLIEQAGNGNNKKNEEYTIPKLLSFIKSNINRFSQSKEKSQYKIDLTKCQQTKDILLREIIWKFVKKMLEQIRKMIDIYKKMLSQVLGLLSEMEGVPCGKQKYRELENYYRQHKLSKFRGIQLPNESLYITKQKLLQSNEESIQDVIIDILEFFREMAEIKDFLDLKDEFNNVLRMSMKFIKVASKLFEKVFSYTSYNELSTMTENVKKSIYVNYLDIICLVENVQQFTIDQIDAESVSSVVYYKDRIYDAYNQNITRIATFKDNLIKYLGKIIKKSDTPHIDKVNVEFLKRIKQISSVLNFEGVQLKIPLLIYKSSHIKLKSKIFIHNPQILHTMIAEINALQMKDNQLKIINNWKNKEQDWELIKGKNYIFFLDFLIKTGYKNKNQLLVNYLHIKQFDDAINLLKSIIQDVENDTFNRLTAHDLCLKAKQNMLEAWYLFGAMKCCKLAEKLYLYEDKTKVFKAQQDYLDILKRLMVQDSTQIINQIDEYSYTLKSSPWAQISDIDYDAMLKTVYQHIQVSLLRENSLNSNKSPYANKSPHERASMEIHKHISADQAKELPIRTRQLSSFQQPQQMIKKQEKLPNKKIELTPTQPKKSLFKAFNTK